MDIKRTMTKVKDLLKERGYNVWGIFLYGSQNYGLETDNSDLDFKCLVIPSFDEVYDNSFKNVVIDTEFGQVDIKDIRSLVSLLERGNVPYMEAVNSNHYLIKTHEDSFKEIIGRVTQSRTNAMINAIQGMVTEKYKKLSHKTPKNELEVEEIGYEKKQLHHIVRLKCLSDSLIDGKDFKESLRPEGEIRDYLIKLKTQPLDVKEAVRIAEEVLDSRPERLDSEKDIIQPISDLDNLIKQIFKMNVMIPTEDASKEVFQIHSHYNQLPKDIKEFLREKYPDINEDHFVDVLKYVEYELYNHWEIKHRK